MEAYIEEDVSETAKQLVTFYSSPACNSKYIFIVFRPIVCAQSLE
jgi:hypothetical protein